MLHILLITFPFFALVLCGYVAAKRRLLPLEAIPGLNSFVLFFALPCMLYRFGSTTPLAQLLDGGVHGGHRLRGHLGGPVDDPGGGGLRDAGERRDRDECGDGDVRIGVDGVSPQSCRCEDTLCGAGVTP